MKYSPIYIVLFFSQLSASWAQTYLVLPDSAHYSIVGLDDTLDIDYNITTSFPHTADLDLDCDGQPDLKINMYPVPVMFFPPEHHIDIINLLGDDLEMLDDGWLLHAFRSSDTVLVDPNAEWISDPSWKLLFFHVVSGASWAGVDGTDSLYINNMYILFRKKISGEWVYGWINYSGKSWNTDLYLRHFAIENEYCTTTATKPVASYPHRLTLYPNPVREELYLHHDPLLVFPLSWTLVDSRGILAGKGRLLHQDDPIHIGAKHLPDGMYFIRFQSDAGGTLMHSRFVVQH